MARLPVSGDTLGGWSLQFLSILFTLIMRLKRGCFSNFRGGTYNAGHKHTAMYRQKINTHNYYATIKTHPSMKRLPARSSNSDSFWSLSNTLSTFTRIISTTCQNLKQIQHECNCLCPLQLYSNNNINNFLFSKLNLVTDSRNTSI